MKKIFIFLLIFILLPVVAACGAKTKTVNEKVDDATFKLSRDIAIAQAIDVYKIRKAQGDNFSDGPCLSNNLIEDWVLDIAHNPRQDVDNEPANQCEAYRNGQAHHFVELDLEGNLIRAE